MADVFAVLDDERDVEDKDHGQDLDGIDQGSAAGDEAGSDANGNPDADAQAEIDEGVKIAMSCVEKVIAILIEIGLPFSYSHFAEGESPDSPFICYLFPGSHNFGADGSVYFKFNCVHIELYTDAKDPVREDRIEKVLDGHGIYYEKTETWIDSEKLYEVLYVYEEEA